MNNFTPYISEVQIRKPECCGEYPFSIPAIASLSSLKLKAPITFFIGKNGSGKSTLLEGIAVAYGFNPEGGSKNMNFETYADYSSLYRQIKLIKGPRRPRDGYFLRAESFYNVASYIEELDSVPAPAGPLKAAYGGNLHSKSHGESFGALFFNRLRGEGLYLLDEPEAALSIDSQLSALIRFRELAETGSQFIVATHSPILLAYPGADIYSFDSGRIQPIRYEDTDIFRIYRYFLNNRQKMLSELGFGNQ